jgi:putrescine transport system permease protein
MKIRPVILIPFLWLALFFLVPLTIVVRLAFSESAQARPPYRPAFAWAEGWPVWLEKAKSLSLGNFEAMLEETLYIDALLSSAGLAATGTALVLLIAYPLAYAIARAPRDRRVLLLTLVVVPFWTSFLIRIYAWIALLKPEGLINYALKSFGLIDAPLPLFGNHLAIVIGIAYSYLPFMVLPLYATLEKLDWSLEEAARDLGATRLRAFWRVTFPQTLRGLIVGILLVFVPALGEFIIPDLLGGSDTLMIGKVMWSEFFGNRDWPMAAALAMLLLCLLAIPLVILRMLEDRRETA